MESLPTGIYAATSSVQPVQAGTSQARTLEPLSKRKRENQDDLPKRLSDTLLRQKSEKTENQRQLTGSLQVGHTEITGVFNETFKILGTSLSLDNVGHYYRIYSEDHEKLMEIENFCLRNLSIKNFHACCSILPASLNYRSKLYAFLCGDAEFVEMAQKHRDYVSQGVSAGVLFLKMYSKPLSLESTYTTEAGEGDIQRELGDEFELLFKNGGLKKLNLTVTWTDYQWQRYDQIGNLIELLLAQPNLQKLTIEGFIFDSLKVFQKFEKLNSLSNLTIVTCGVDNNEPRPLNKKDYEEIRRYLPNRIELSF